MDCTELVRCLMSGDALLEFLSNLASELVSHTEAEFDDELELQHTEIEIPALLIHSIKRNPAIAAALSAEMDRRFVYLTTRQIQTGHWALVEAPTQVNSYISDWIRRI